MRLVPQPVRQRVVLVALAQKIVVHRLDFHLLLHGLINLIVFYVRQSVIPSLRKVQKALIVVIVVHLTDFLFFWVPIFGALG